MKKDFLDEYIQLEKLCNDIFRAEHGVSKYIETLERGDCEVKNRIPKWAVTYRKLKNLRWKRNQYVHEGNALFEPGDAEWLSDFRKRILNGEDPLSLERKLHKKAPNKATVMKTPQNGPLTPSQKSHTQARQKSHRGVVIAIVVAIVVAIVIALGIWALYFFEIV